MVISLGGGTMQAAVLSMNSIVTAETSPTGGLHFDDAIITYTRRKYGVIIGQPTAELLKIKIGSAIPQEQQQAMEVQGQDQVSGLPRPVNLTTDDIMEALQDPMTEVVNTARKVLEKTPPELLSDIIDRGVALCGGGSLLRGVDKYLTKALGIPAYLVDNPMTCTAEGAAKAQSMRDVLRRSLPFCIMWYGSRSVLEIIKTNHRQKLKDKFGVRHLYLFGSIARNEASAGSDVDFLVEFTRPTGLFGLSFIAGLS